MNKQELNRFIDKISPTGPGGIEKIKRVLKTVLDKEGEDGITEEELLEALTTKQDTIQDLSEIRSGADLGATAYQKPSAGIPSTDMTDTVQQAISFAESTEKRSYNSSNPDGMGYLVLKKNKTFAEQVTQANTIYEVRCSFTIGSDFSIPAGCILNFCGGMLTGDGDITFNDTLLMGDVLIENDFSGTLKNDFVTPEMFGAKGDGDTDDTGVFSKLDGKEIHLGEKTYLVTGLDFGIGTRLIGCGIEKSIILQKETATGDCIRIAGYCSAVKNLSIHGHRDIEVVGNDVYRALLKVYGTGNGGQSGYFFDMTNVLISETNYSGLVLIGSSTGDPNMPAHNSWIFHIDNIFVKSCNCWCMIDETSDNTFSNISLSYGGLGNFLCRAGSNMYSNLKLDGQGGYLGDPDSLTDGCLMLISNWANNCHFSNLDVQSGQYGGIKINQASWLSISGNINNCGVGYGSDDSARKGAFIHMNNAAYVQINLTMFKINYQTKYGYYIANTCSHIWGFIQNVNRLVNVNLSPDSCRIFDSNENPYIDEKTIDFAFRKFTLTGEPVSCYPVEKYRLDVTSVISSAIQNLSLTNIIGEKIFASSYNDGGIRATANFATPPTLKDFIVEFEITTDYSPASRLVQIIDDSGNVVDAAHPATNERSFTIHLSTASKISKIHILAGASAADSTGHNIAITSLTYQRIGGEYSVDLGRIVSVGEFNWKTGELDENGIITKYEPVAIYATGGENVLSGNTASLKVSGALSLYAPTP